MNEFDPLEFLKNIILVFVIGIIGGLAFYIIQGAMLPTIYTNMTGWDSSMVSLFRVFFPLALLAGFIIIMLLIFFKPKSPLVFRRNNVDYYEQAVQQRQNRRRTPPTE